MDVNGPVIGGIVGTLGVIGVLFGAYHVYLYKKRTELRQKKLKMSARFVEQRNTMYGISAPEHIGSEEDPNPRAPSVVMYTLNVDGYKANGLASKRAFPPVNASATPKGSSV